MINNIYGKINYAFKKPELKESSDIKPFDNDKIKPIAEIR